MHTINEPVGSLIADVGIIPYNSLKERNGIIKKMKDKHYFEVWDNIKCIYIDFKSRR